MNGTVDSQRTSDDGQVVSYCIITDKGFNTTRHRRFLRPLGAENDPKISKESVVSNNRGKTTDLPISDDIIGPVTPRAPPRWSRVTKIVTESRTRAKPMTYLFLMTSQGLSHREHPSGGPEGLKLQKGV